MKRFERSQPVHLLERRLAPARSIHKRAEWVGLTLPNVPTAEWPASVVLEQTIDRVARDAISSGHSLQEAVAKITEMTHALLPQMTEAEIDRRIHAQLLANS